MKVLLIEYEPRYVERIRGFLAGQEHEIVVARDGDEGLEAYRRSRPDLVLISSVLPKLRTPDVIKGMQALGSPPPILLMMSGYKGRNKRADAQRVGARSILEKPFGEEAFRAEVAAAVGQAPVLDVAGSTLPGLESGEPLLSADDIFSDIVSGIESDSAAAVLSPGTDPGVARRTESSAGRPIESLLAEALGTPMPKVEPGAPTPFDTLKVNLTDLVATTALPLAKASGKPAEKPSDKPKVSSSASVDRLLKDTLSGLKIRPRSASTGTTDPGLAVPAPSAGPRSGVMPASRLPSSPSLPAPPAPRSTPAPLLAPVSTVSEPSTPGAAETVPTAPVPRVPRPASGPGTFGRFQLLERIASGGMADVFKARMSGEEGFEKIVAIKRILPHLATNEGFITMFVDEAKLAAQLTHNNIIHIYELGKVEAWHYIAMEYVDGKDLRSILKMGRDRGYLLPVELALFVASRIANALDYAHRRLAPDGRELNLVHRDVSPQNILISWEGDIKLCDFGVAKAATKVGTTISGALKGKLQYMSPEQAYGKKVDRRSDIFSLGAVLFEALTGRPLFEGENDFSVLEKVRSGLVAAPSTVNPEVPPRVDEIVLKALAREPQERYQNASELDKDLLSVLYGYQPSPGPADLAIYLHRLLETPPAATDEDIEAAFAAAQKTTEETPAPKKGKGLVRAKSSGEHLAPTLPVPALVPKRPAGPTRPMPVAAPPAALDVGAESKKSRAGLLAGIGIAAVALVAVAFFVLRGRGGAPFAAAPVPAPEAPKTAEPATPATIAPAAEAPKVIDLRAVDTEARRLAAEAEKARRETEKKAGPGKTAPAPTAPALSLAPRGALEPPKPAEALAEKPAEKPTEKPVEKPTEKPAEKPAPQTVPVAEPPATRTAPQEATKLPTQVSVPEAPPPQPAPLAGPAKEGDLVGPGEGIVEPRVVKMGAFTGLPPQSRQLARGSADGSIGTSVLMALIDENGAVSEVRVVKPAPYKFVDEAAMRALKSARIASATKDGVKVKMWSTFAVTVKP